MTELRSRGLAAGVIPDPPVVCLLGLEAGPDDGLLTGIAWPGLLPSVVRQGYAAEEKHALCNGSGRECDMTASGRDNSDQSALAMFAAELRAVRARAGLSRNDLAAQLNYSGSLVGMIRAWPGCRAWSSPSGRTRR